MTQSVAKVVTRAGRRPTRFGPITASPYKAEIDEKLFKYHIPVLQVVQWLHEIKGETSITQSMLYRYFNATQDGIASDIVISNARDMMEDSVDILGMILARYKQGLADGIMPRSSDAINAVKVINALIEKHGGIPGRDTILEDAKRRIMMFADIVADIVTDAQKQELLARISETPELMEWMSEEDE